MFTVSKSFGFLPRMAPLRYLPPKYEIINQLLQEAVIHQPNGSKGRLYHGEMGTAITKQLPLFDVSKENDQQLVCALLRDYSFLASQYLLEPCGVQFRKDKTYGFGRERLPQNIALPLVTLSDKLECFPFLEYAHSNTLFNYYKTDPEGSMNYSNLGMIRYMEGSNNEKGFVLTHASIDGYSNNLVTHVYDSMVAVESDDRAAFNKAMIDLR